MCNNNLCQNIRLCARYGERPGCAEKSRFYNFMKHVFRLNKNHQKLSKDYKEISEIIHKLYEHQEKQNDRQLVFQAGIKCGKGTLTEQRLLEIESKHKPVTFSKHIQGDFKC